MPYVTEIGNLRWVHDTNEDYRQLWKMDAWNEEYDPRDKALQLTQGDKTPDTSKTGNKKQKKYVHRSYKVPDKGYWQDNPVFRVLIEDMNVREQLRFMERFTNTKRFGLHAVRYEPEMYDVQEFKTGDYVGYSLPIWMLDYMIANRYLENAEKCIKLPGVPHVDPDDFACYPDLTAEFKKSYVDRKKKEENRYSNYIKTLPEDLVNRFKAFKLEECEEINLEGKAKVRAAEDSIEEKTFEEKKAAYKNALKPGTKVGV